jgi:hypothetical protein
MMTITASWLNNEFKMNEVVLSFRELVGQHFGANICTMFLDVMNEYGLKDKVNTLLPNQAHFLQSSFLVHVRHN